MQKSYTNWLKANVPIFISGKSGTGKSSLARELHFQSSRVDQPFMAINMAAVHPHLFESEIFGHVKGSFTGAHQNRLGFCDIVGDGTLFLDEIGDLSFSLQAKLLQLIEEKIYYQVGSNQPRKFKGRFILASNKDIVQLVNNGHFRQDLWERIKYFNIHLESILPGSDLCRNLIQNLIEELSLKYQKRLFFTSCAMRWLEYFPYEGNIRQMKAMIEKIFIEGEHKVDGSFLEETFSSIRPNELIDASISHGYYDELKKFEVAFLKRHLKINHGKLNITAKSVGISKVTLLKKIRTYKLEGYI